MLTLNVASGHETAGFSPTRHMELIAEHAPGLRLDTVVADETFAGEDETLEAACARLGARLVIGDVAMHDNTAGVGLQRAHARLTPGSGAGCVP